MPPLSAEELRERLERDLPEALQAPDATRIAPLHLLAVARYVRDTLGYTFLANLTAVDYLADGEIEIVYHFAMLTGGAPQAIRVRTPRDEARVPSLSSIWPGAELQEREAYDLFGVWFEGHPNLRRVYMWDEFEGFPMRKDFPRQGDKYFAGDEGE